MEEKKIFGLLNDTVFKYVFTDRRCPGPLKCLLNGLLELQEDERIGEGALRIEVPVKVLEAIDDHGASFDALARDNKGRIYHVEVQQKQQKHFGSRLLYYLSHHYGRQLKKGDWYGDLNKTVTLAIMNFTLFKTEPAVKNLFEMCKRNTELVLTGEFEAYCLELEKFNGEDPYALDRPLDRWLHLLKYSERYYTAKRLPEPLRQEEGLEMVMERMKEVNRKPKLRTRMEAIEKIRRDNANYVHDILVEVEEEMQKAHDINQKAREEKRQIARAMKAEGIETAVISRVTGFTGEDLAEI